MDILKSIAQELKSKKCIIEINETEKSYILLIKNTINRHVITEDLEILKSFVSEENRDAIMNNILYLYHNSLDRYLRGD